MTERIPPHEPGSFNWCVDRVDLGHDTLSAIVRVLCRDQTVWPEQLLGRPGAGAAVSRPDSPPVATGHSLKPRREPRFVFTRRLVWRLAGELTDLSDAEIAELVGGYKPATVAPWTRSWAKFRQTERDGWWARWGPCFTDLAELGGGRA